MRIATIVLLMMASVAHAGPTRVAVIDAEKLYEPGGISKWLAARAKLDAERPKFKVVEKPADSKPPTIPVPDWCNKPTKDWEKKACADLREVQRKSIEGDEWTKHEREVLGPIETDVDKELQRYAVATGIDILLDRSEMGEAVLFVSASANITDAFIKSYNAKKK